MLNLAGQTRIEAVETLTRPGYRFAYQSVEVLKWEPHLEMQRDNGCRVCPRLLHCFLRTGAVAGLSDIVLAHPTIVSLLETCFYYNYSSTVGIWILFYRCKLDLKKSTFFYQKYQIFFMYIQFMEVFILLGSQQLTESAIDSADALKRRCPLSHCMRLYICSGPGNDVYVSLLISVILPGHK